MIVSEDFAKLARSLVGPLGEEPRIRCALGRAYYAAYHHCLACANSFCGELTKEEAEKKGNHEKLYLRLESHSKDPKLDEPLRTIADYAKKLRNLRVRADYHLIDDTLTTRDLKDGIRLLGNVEDTYKILFPPH